MAVRCHSGQAPSELQDVRSLEGREHTGEFSRHTSHGLEIELEIANLEVCRQGAHIHLPRVWFVVAEDQATPVWPYVNAMIEDSYGRLRVVDPWDGLRDIELVAGRDDRHGDPCHLAERTRPRPGRVDDHRCAHPPFVGHHPFDRTAVGGDASHCSASLNHCPQLFRGAEISFRELAWFDVQIPGGVPDCLRLSGFEEWRPAFCLGRRDQVNLDSHAFAALDLVHQRFDVLGLLGNADAACLVDRERLTGVRCEALEHLNAADGYSTEHLVSPDLHGLCRTHLGGLRGWARPIHYQNLSAQLG